MKRFDSLRFLVGDPAILDGLAGKREHIQPFADETIGFLNGWAGNLRKLPENKKDGSTAAFAFWCREANLKQLRKDYPDLTDGEVRYTGRGVCLQFAPSNVPALFAYSLAAGLLSGNSVIMRLPAALSETSRSMVEALQKTIAEYPSWQSRIVLLQYGHEKEITDELSGVCNIRVIWGGDSSIADIQKSPVRQSCTEITFPNRRSMALIDANAVLNDPDPESTARRFYNDTYLNDQNACSSPSFICWMGEEKTARAASDMFFDRLEHFLAGRYEVQSSIAVKKYEKALYLAAEGMADAIKTNENAIVRVTTSKPDERLWDHMIPGGFFAEYFSGADPATFPDEGSKRMLTDVCQTISCFGADIKEAEGSVKRALPKSHFQFTEMGYTLDFNLVWDGTDLIRKMCTPIAQEYFIERKGCLLYVRKQGEGPLLLLIHGVACDSDYYNETAEILSKYFTVITYDRRGYTRSRYADGYQEEAGDASLENQADDAAEILRRFIKEEEQPVIAGCSAGGIVALHLVWKNPHLAGKLFLYETVYTINDETLKGLEEWKEKLKEAGAKNRLASAMLLFINAIGPHDEMAPALSVEAMQNNMNNLDRFMKLEMEDFLGYSKTHRNIKLDVPVFCGAGTFDSMTMFYRMIHDAAESWGVECEELEGCHNIAQDRPKTFAGWILRHCLEPRP